MGKKLCKIIFGSIIVSMLMFSNVIASPLEKLSESEECDEIYSLENDILRFVNGGPVSETGSRDATGSDIDFENAIKEYLDPQFIVEQISSYEEAMDLLNSSVYMWIIPVRVDGHLYDACISKPIDDNGSMYGDWRMDSVYVSVDGAYTLGEQLELSLQKNDINESSYDFKLVGGMYPIRYQVFLAINKEGVKYLIPAKDTASVAITDSSQNQTTRSIENNTEFGVIETGEDGFTAYDFSKFLNARILTSPIGSGTGGAVIDLGQTRIPYKECFTFFGVSIVCLFIIGVRYRKKYIKQ